MLLDLFGSAVFGFFVSAPGALLDAFELEGDDFFILLVFGLADFGFFSINGTF